MSTTILDTLLAISILMQKDLEQSFEASGLTASRTHLLWELNRLGPSTQRELADALDVTARNVTGLVDALEATGFVTRGKHPTDRRATVVTLTDTGARVMRAMERDHDELSRKLVARLSDRNVASVESGLSVILANLNELLDAASSGSTR